MRRTTLLLLLSPLLLVLALPVLAARRGRSKSLPEDPRHVPVEAQLSLTRTRADLDGDGVKEMLWLVNALTGKDEPAKASEVALAVEIQAGEGEGRLAYSRWVSRATDRPAHDGELAAIDLDGDGGAEIILSWDRSLSAERIDRWAEIYAIDDLTRPRLVWEGSWKRDTRRDPATPKAEREWYECEIDYGATRREGGRALWLRKTYKMIAGAALDPPRSSVDRVAVRLRPESSSP